MPDVALIEWTFEPPDMFEQKVSFVADAFEFVIDSGRAECRVPMNRQATDLRNLRSEAHHTLDAMFLAALTLSHKAYRLNEPNLTVIDEHGIKHHFAFPDALMMHLVPGRVDTVVTGTNGEVIADSKADRIRARNQLACAAAMRVADSVANSILRSYSAAVNDPANELLHLYEIREALASHFGGAALAQKALGISSSRWSALGRLANDEPLLQGRHRGKHPGTLRSATAQELEDVRDIVREMIGGYLRSQ